MTPSLTPTTTPSLSPTATPSGSVCATFATGVCCDSAAGTNCAAPLVVCTANTACAGLAPYTTCAGAPSDGAWAGSTQTTTYPPTFNQCFPADTVVAASRNLNGGKYMVNDGLLQWDTSSLPDTATVTSASLRVYVLVRDSINARDFQGEWYNWGATCDGADWTATAASTAFTTPIIGLTLNADNDVPLSAVTNVNLAGRTALRLHVSGGVPTGLNRVLFADYEHATQPGPRLVVCYTP